jgi:hypothetical protein
MGDIGKIIIKPAGPITIEKGPSEATYYANIVMVVVSPEEVIFHFGLRDEEDPFKGIGVAKVYLGPAHAKRLMNALKNGIEQVESIFGKINENPVEKLTPEQLEQLQQEKTEK